MHERAPTQAKRDCGEGGDQLRSTLAAELLCHEAGEHDGCGFGDSRKEPEAGEGSAKKNQRKAAEEGRERRIGNKAPVEVARVFQRREFIAMKAVLAAGDEVDDDGCESDAKKNGKIAGPKSLFQWCRIRIGRECRVIHG